MTEEIKSIGLAVLVLIVLFGLVLPFALVLMKYMLVMFDSLVF